MRGDSMVYLSKGVVQENSTKNNLVICRFGDKFNLTDGSAALWLYGRFNPNETNEDRASTSLIEMGLIEASSESGETALYRLLLNCVICHAKSKLFKMRLDKPEQILWTWLTQAGGKLTISELVALNEKQVSPSKSLLGTNNWASLVHSIYTRNNIQDLVLEAQMEKSPAMRSTVMAVMGLLRKKRIFLI